MTVPDFTNCCPAEARPVRAGEIHLWRIDLSERTWPAACPQVLGDEERSRYARFKYARDAGRFAARRVALRCILGGYLGAKPSALRLDTKDTAGKPSLAPDTGSNLRFNASSSADLGLIAIGTECALGVDIEAARPVKDLMGIAQRFFMQSELSALEALPMADQVAGFYRLWTSKEALLKAIGTGLPGGLDRFETSADPGRAPRLMRDHAGSSALVLYPADAAKGYLGAIAADQPGLSLRTFALPLQVEL